MGGQMWQLLEAQAKALGEGTEFRQFRRACEAIVGGVSAEGGPEDVKRELAAALAPPPQPTALLTRHELMRRWRIGRNTIRRYERQGLPVAMRVGRSFRYDWEEVERWREAVLRGEQVDGASIGDFKHGIRRERSGRSASRGETTTAASSRRGPRRSACPRSRSCSRRWRRSWTARSRPPAGP